MKCCLKSKRLKFFSNAFTAPTAHCYFTPFYYKVQQGEVYKLFLQRNCFHFYIRKKYLQPIKKQQMKKVLLTLLLGLSISVSMAQVPDVMNYQAVARNNSGQALASQTIKVRLSILKNAVMQYSETRQVFTNALGLFNVQIGSTGAITTTGSFSGIDWQNNAAPGYVLKIELDVNNSGTFTDMGSQSLVTVPYAFAAKKSDKATETVNLAGRPLNTTTAPNVGSKLIWDGSSWSPVRDTIIPVMVNAVLAAQGAGPTAQWVFLDSDLPVVTVNGNETVLGTIWGNLHDANVYTTPLSLSASLCYQLLPNGPITPFGGISFNHDLLFPDGSLLTPVTVCGAEKLPAGTYKVGFGVKNKSSNASTSLRASILTGYVQVKQ